MTIHILRDYAAAATGYYSPGGGINYFYTPHIYNLPIFLNKVLGYSVVGQNAWDINNTNVQTFNNTATVSIAAGSNGASLPQPTIFATTTTGFPNSGVIFVSAAVSTTIAASSNGQTLPQSTINVASTASFMVNGTIQVVTSNGTQTVTYTGVNGTQFTGCTGGTGTMTTGGSVTATTPQTVNYSGITANAFLNCTGGSGIMTAGAATTTTGIQALPTATINVSSTTGFPTSGTIYIVTSAGIQTVTYTGGGGGGTTFTGCSGGTGSTSAGGSVTSAGGAISCTPLKIVTNTGATPATLTLNFPHGMSNGQYVNVTGTNNPWPINVTAINQIQLLTTVSTIGSAGSIVYPPGMLIASGTVAGGNGASINVAGASSVYAVSIPPNIRTVVNGTAPTAGDAGRILVLKSPTYPTKNSGLFKISATNTGAGTTIAAGSNNLSLPQSTINVASTTGFPASGTIFVYTSTGVQTVTYTGGGGGGTTFTGCSGGTGTMSTGNTVNNFNGYNIDYRSTDTPPQDTMDWWLYEVETQVSNYVNYPNNNQFNVSLLGTTNTAPIQVTTNINQQGPWKTGQSVTISGVTGNTNANGTWTITVQSPTTTSGIFTLNGSVGNGTSGSVGSVVRNGYTGGDNVSFNSKTILQSPHPSGWQVRIAVELFNTTFMPVTSVTVGYGGSIFGDWPVGGTHTHTPQFLDVNMSNTGPGLALEGSVPGSSNTNLTATRIGIVGDDAGQAVFHFARSQGAGANGLVTFGIPDNEPTPLQPNINRIFVYGGANSSDYGGLQMRFGLNSNNFGLSFRDINPEVCAIAGWVNMDGISGAVPAYSANAGDSPFTGTTEVLPWEIWAGIATDPQLNLPFNSNLGAPPYGLNQRFMGTAPFIRQGRTNFGSFTLSTDSVATSTITAATNTSPIQITTSAANALATGQTVVITGVTGNTAANGTWVITVIDNTHFTLNNSTGNGGFAGGGTVQGTPHWLHLQNGIYLQWNGASGLTP
jgi:hypothetical protein